MEVNNTNKALRVNISASGISNFFDHACPRILAYNIITDPEKVGWDKKTKEHTSAQDAGKLWEWETLKILQDNGQLYYAEDKDGNIVKDVTVFKTNKERINGFRDISEETTIDIFKDPVRYIQGLDVRRTGYIYQTKIRAPQIFMDEEILRDEKYADLCRAIFDHTDEIVRGGWVTCKPDLIRVDIGEDDIPVFSVIDMKHAKHARMSHKVQIAIYAMILDAMFREQGIEGKVNLETGYLWNFRKAEPHAFDLTVVMPYVRELLDKELPEALIRIRDCYARYSSGEAESFNGSIHAVPTFMCDLCGNFENCIKWQKAHEPVTLMPYLSSYAQEYLRKNHVPLTIEGFRKHIADEDNKKKLSEDCFSLKKILINGEADLNALESKLLANAAGTGPTAVIKEQSSLAMPSWQDVSIVITAQRDEAMDRMYALGLRVSVHKEDVDPLGTDMRTTESGKKYANAYENIFVAKSRDDIDDTIRQFMECLYEILSKISDHNRGIENDRDRLTIQGYVMDNYEYINLEEMLMDELLNGAGTVDTAYRNILLEILFWLQGEDMVTQVEEQARSLGVDFPVIVITSAVKRLFAIPAFITYDLETVDDALVRQGAYRRFDTYARRLSNAMKSDPINRVWDKENPSDDDLKGIVEHIRIRLSNESRIVRSIQEKLKGKLRRRPEPFRLQSTGSEMDVRSAKLWSEYQYESLLAYHDMRSVRMSDLKQMADDGVIIRATLEEEIPFDKVTFPGSKPGFRCRYRLENHDTYFNGAPFMGIMIAAGDEAAEDELAGLSKRAEENSDLPMNLEIDGKLYYTRVFGVDNTSISIVEGTSYVWFERFRGTDEIEKTFVRGKEVYIVERFKDLQRDKEVAAFNKETAQMDPECENTGRAYLYPESWIKKTEDAADLNECLKHKPYDGGYDFTKSQQKAFAHLFENNLTLLLGPPGTGKTDFIARAVITLCKYYANEKGRLLSVAVSANSHSAINNILAKLYDKLEGAAGEPVLYKLDKWSDGEGDEIEGVKLAKDFVNDPSETKSRDVYSHAAEKPIVMGATPWQVYKSATSKYGGIPAGFTGYDVVVIDEASQLLMSAALLPMQASFGKQGTRFLIVGDEDQLPPVLKGKYDTSDQPVDFYGSVFRAYYDTALAHGLDYIVPLEEQFRMNEILSRYSAETIYDADMEPGDGRSGYHAFDFGKDNAVIATQELSLAGKGEDELTDMICDPDYPLIVCRIHDGGAGQKRDAEIDLATSVVKFLRANMIDPDTGSVYPDGEEGDAQFWGSSSGEGGLGIISPHHEQINRLRRNITEQTGMANDSIFIGTVDKLQGRQREAVIVSYGVTDPEKAASELEFIYSRNRLNVALTRGKKKTICILSDTLLDTRPEVLSVDDDDTLKGINFMTGLVDFMKREEDDTVIDCDIDRVFGDVKIDVYRKRMKG